MIKEINKLLDNGQSCSSHSHLVITLTENQHMFTDPLHTQHTFTYRPSAYREHVTKKLHIQTVQVKIYCVSKTEL